MKRYLLPLAAAAITLAASSCGSASDKSTEPAARLLDQARNAVDSKNYEQARLLLDSLDSAYSDAVDVRRQAMPVRASMMEGLSLQLIPEADERIARCMMLIDQLGKNMADDGDKFEPFKVPAGWPRRGDIKAEGIEPRVDRNGFFRLVVKNSGKALGLNSLRVGEATTAPLPSGRVSEIEGVELMSLSQEEFAPVAQWLEANQGVAPDVELVGAKGVRKIKFTAQQARMLLEAWQYSQAYQELAEAQKERERLERQLKIARDQAAQFNG